MKLVSKIKRVFREGGFSLVWKKIWRRVDTNYLSHFRRQAPISYLSLFAHQMPNGLPPVEVEIKIVSATEEDVALAKRLLSAYHKSLNEGGGDKKSVAYGI